MLPVRSTTPAASMPAPARAVRDDASPAGRALGRDVAITALTQVAIAVGGLLLYRLLAVKKGADGVAAYSLVKQLVVFVWPLVMFGSQTAIPRYVALARDRAGEPGAYLLAAFMLTGTVAAPICAAALLAPKTAASLAFGSSHRSYLVVPLVATLASTVMLEVTYGYHRGQSNFRVGNALRAVCVALFPVVLLIVEGGRAIDELIVLMAVAVVVGCVAAIGLPLLRALQRFDHRLVVAAGRKLLDYGHRRVPGDFAHVVLFAVPTVLAAHYAPLHGVAYLSAGLYVLAVVSIAVLPIGQVFLPVLSRLCASDFEAARRYVAELATCAIHIALFVTPQLTLFAFPAVRAWLGADFEHAGRIVTITVLPAGFYVLVSVLRSALDAAAVKAYNARNNLGAVAIAAVAVTISLATGVASPLECIAGSFALGLLALGALTLVSVQRVYRLDASAYSLPIAAALAAAAAAIGWAIKTAVLGRHASPAELGAIGALEIALGAFYLVSLARAGVRWPSLIGRRLGGRS